MMQKLSEFQHWMALEMGQSAAANWAATIIMMLATTLVFLAFWYLFNRLTRALDTFIDDNTGDRITSLRIQKQALVSEEDLSRVLHGIVRFIWWIGSVFLFLLYLNSALSYIDWFHELTVNIFSVIAGSLALFVRSVVGYFPNLVIILLITLITRLFLHLVQLIFKGIRSQRIRIPGFFPEWARTTFNLVRIAVIMLTVVVIFPYLPGAESPAFKGLSIFFGVLLSLGSTAAIAHIVAGIVITYTRAFRIGDRVRIADTEGDIIERNAFVTRVRTPKNVEVAIPNAMVMNNHIINYSAQARMQGVLLHTTVTIGYEVPWPKVHELLIEAARRTEHLEPEPEPFVLQTALQDDNVAYELNAYTAKPSGKTRIYSDLHANIQDVFREADLEILSPRYRAVRTAASSTVPPNIGDDLETP